MAIEHRDPTFNNIFREIFKDAFQPVSGSSSTAAVTVYWRRVDESEILRTDETPIEVHNA